MGGGFDKTKLHYPSSQYSLDFKRKEHNMELIIVNTKGKPYLLF